MGLPGRRDGAADNADFEVVLAARYGRLLRAAWLVTGDRSAALRLVDEVLERTWRERVGRATPEKLGAWLDDRFVAVCGLRHRPSLRRMLELPTVVELAPHHSAWSLIAAGAGAQAA